MTKIYEGNQCIIIHAGYSDPAAHRHMAAHIILAVDGELTVHSGGKTLSCRGIMIPSGVDHRIDTHGNDALIFLFDCTSTIAQQILQTCVMPEAMCCGIMDWYDQLENCNKKNFPTLENVLLTYLEIPESRFRVKDNRIMQAMDYIRSMFTERLTCADVAGFVHLSQDRFSHLFKQETGISFAGYLIYQRLMYVYAEVFRGKSITEAALQAGFSGSSHFADVNRRVFGLSMREIMENASFQKLAEIWK